MNVPHYAIVLKWEVFEVGNELNTSVGCLLDALHAEDAPVTLACLTFLHRVKYDEDVEIAFLSSLAKVLTHITLVKAAVGEDDHEWQAICTTQALTIEHLIRITNEVSHSSVRTLGSTEAKSELTKGKGGPLI